MKSFWSQERNVWPQALLRKRYKVVYADPPWQLADNEETRLGRHKRLLNAIDLASLPVGELVDGDAVLALWWPSNRPLEALQIMKEWGFRLYRMNGLTWIKKGRAMVDSELCLFAVRGEGIEYLKDWNTSGVLEQQSRQAGEKPLEALKKVERLVPAVPKLELFSDSGRDGWDSWLPNPKEVLS